MSTELTAPSQLPTPELLAEARRLADAATGLEAVRLRLCPYCGPTCDCKFGSRDAGRGLGEQTGCPELRQAIAALSLVPELADRLAALTAAVERVEALCVGSGIHGSLIPREAVRAALEGRAS